ncbi:hypothetical protein K435DRAFT_369131 [Dendrothele bispora CBS 962.96]|uniref:Purine-cytosine permease n=1 Tax=Dendrothele bispora (strain CBS 962.96) TaxID=1314807 RepID=A0A4S8LC70_DENBC|nr:hypothetical protein K435DRAFT_369131 [Dendrothele bispora CBS 962.96]
MDSDEKDSRVPVGTGTPELPTVTDLEQLADAGTGKETHDIDDRLKPQASSQNSSWRLRVKKILLWGVETHGISPTLVSERTDPRIYQMFTVWFSAILNLTGLSTGALGPVVFGLGMRDSALVCIVADIIGCIIPAYFVVFGPKIGTRTMAQSRFSFGYYGTSLPSLLNVISQGGWLIINSIVGGQVLAAVSPDKLDDTLGIVVIVLITFVISFFGYTVLHWYETYIWIPNIVLFIAMLGVGGKNLSLASSDATNSTSSASVAVTASALISYGTTVYASDLTWCTLAADYGIYHDSRARTWKIFLYAYAGIFLSAFIGHILGLSFSATAPFVPSWSSALGSGDDFGTFVVAILEPLGGFGKFLVVLGALTVTAPCALTMYSFGVSLMNVSPVFAKVPRYIYMVVATAIVIPLAIVGATRFFTALESVLNLIGYWASSYASIILCEHFIFRHSRCVFSLLVRCNRPLDGSSVVHGPNSKSRLGGYRDFDGILCSRDFVCGVEECRSENGE